MSINYVTDGPTTAKEILKDTYKENNTFQLMDDAYFVGMVDDAAVQAGAVGNTAHITNALTAIFIACGQDVACIAEAAVGKFAEVCCAVALAGELSIGAAIAEGHFAAAHQAHGRKR